MVTAGGLLPGGQAHTGLALWVATTHGAWLRADQVVLVEPGPGEQAGEFRVVVALPAASAAGSTAGLARYPVLTCASEPEAAAAAFALVRCIATQLEVAGIVQFVGREAVATPFGELDEPAER